MSGIELQSHQVIIRPLVTEKGVHQSEKYNAYAFEVHHLGDENRHPQSGGRVVGSVRVVAVRTQNSQREATAAAD